MDIKEIRIMHYNVECRGLGHKENVRITQKAILDEVEQILFTYGIYSDSSPHCMGTRWLKERVEELKSNLI